MTRRRATVRYRTATAPVRWRVAAAKQLMKNRHQRRNGLCARCRCNRRWSAACSVFFDGRPTEKRLAASSFNARESSSETVESVEMPSPLLSVASDLWIFPRLRAKETLAVQQYRALCQRVSCRLPFHSKSHGSAA